MRLPRFQITVGSLLFAVAIVAFNCWVYRAVETWERHGPGNHALWRLNPVEILLFLPLINVSAIGSCLFLRKWIRTARSVEGAVDASPPPAMTFFCLNFLAIGYLACNFMEEKVGEILDPAAEWVESWMGWEILDSDVEGFFLGLILVSGPLLVLAWIGRVIARRAASRLPRWRFLALSALVSIGFAAVALAIVLPLRPFNDSGDFDLEFRVDDQDSGQPIEGASVQITLLSAHLGPNILELSITHELWLDSRLHRPQGDVPLNSRPIPQFLRGILLDCPSISKYEIRVSRRFCHQSLEIPGKWLASRLETTSSNAKLKFGEIAGEMCGK